MADQPIFQLHNQPLSLEFPTGEFPTGNDHCQPSTVNGWKEIASELDHSVRTVQRWERELRLPVHRLGKGAHPPVFAFKKELQLWLHKTAIQDGSRQTERNPKPELIASIEKFLDVQSAHQKDRRCSRCRSDMKHLDVHFWLYGSENGWRVSVPFCPTCEPELCKHSPEIC